MVDLSVLSLGGDAGSIRSSSVRWSQFSSATGSAAGAIRRIDSGDFKGDEAELFRDRLSQDLPPHLDTTSDAWAQVAGALTAYAATLEGLQSRMASLSAQAAHEQSQVNTATGVVADAQTADTRHATSVAADASVLPPGQVLPADAYQSQAAAASVELSGANAALQSTMDAASRIRGEHAAAVDVCVAAINGASGLRFAEPPGFWGRLGDAVSGWVRDNVDVLKAISAVLKQISGIAGLLAMIPLLAPLMGPIAAFSSAGSVLIDAAVMYATGEGSVTDLLMDAAGVIPGGRAATEAARGASAVVGAAKTVATVTKDAKTLASEARTAKSAVSEVRTAENAAGDVHGVKTTAAAADKAGSRAADNADSAVKNATPADSLPCKGDPIDIVSGDMIMIQTDLELPGVLPLILKRVYKSSYQWGGAFGNSWASTLDQRIELGADGGACFVAEDGVVLYYPGALLVAAGTALWPTEGIQRWPLRRIADGGWTVEDPDAGITRRFAVPDADERCVLTDITDRHDNTVHFDYDAAGAVCAVRHSGGYLVEILSTNRWVTGLMVHDRDDATMITSFGYDAAGNMLQVNNSDRESLDFEWDSSGRIVGWKDRNGIWYRYEYDEVGRCVRTSGRGRILSYGFSYLPGRTLVTDSLGAVSIHEYNQSGQVTREIDALGNVTGSVWDRFGRLLLRTDPLGRTTQFAYDPAGRLEGIIHPDGARESLQRNVLGLPVAIVDATGAVWKRGYDAVGNMTSETDPLGNTTRLTYAPTGAVASVTGPVGGATTTASNDAGLPLEMVDAVGGRTCYGYDGFGRVVRIVDPVGGVSTLGWTVAGKLAYAVGPDGARQEWTWDGEGNLTRHVDPVGARTVIENGVLDLPVARTGPDGGTMRFGYDTELRLTSVQNPAGLRWLYRYDAAGRLVGETDFNGRTQTYRHDGAGRLVAMVNGLGQHTNLVYDIAGDLVERSTADGSTRMSYDAAGRLLRAESAGSVVHLDRDRCGRVIRETVNGRSVTFDFDSLGRRIGRQTPEGVLSQWKFDAAGRPQTLSTAGQDVSFTFDDAGREVGRSFSAGGRLTRGFDTGHRLVSQVMGVLGDPVAASTGEPIRATARSFAYRADGVLVGIGDELTGGSRRFDLDTSGRVVGVQAARWIEGYAYDRTGNLAAATLADRAGDAQSVSTREYSGTLTTRAGGVSYGHDRQGRVVTRSRKRLSRRPETWQYRYDADDRMISASSAGQLWVYHYDPFGRRISKQRLDADGRIVEQTLFSWDGNRLIEQTRTESGVAGAAVTTWEYLPGSWAPISQTVGGTDLDARFYAIISDLVGSPTELVTPDGARVAWSNDDATLWGAPRAQGKADLNRSSKYAVDCPIRFPGQYADDETGLHYNRHRYYDPASARYTTSDPLGLAPADDPHSYVANPTRWADPLGLGPCAGQVGNGPAPENAWSTLDHVDTHGVAPSSHNLPKWQGKRRPFQNDGRDNTALLPGHRADGAPVGYTEFDVNPFVPKAGRGSQRLVTGTDGSAYYTGSHYEDWIRMR